MQEEAAQELIQGYGHQFLLIVVRRVAPAKGDLAVGQRDQSMVGDGDTVSVAAEVLEHILGATEGVKSVVVGIAAVWPVNVTCATIAGMADTVT